MDATKLEKLHEMKEQGILTQEEFDAEKAKLLNAGTATESSSAVAKPFDNKLYAMFLHLGQFAGVIIPYGGLLLPLIMWIAKRDDEYVDQQGRVVLNWMISFVIYSVIGFILTFIVIGAFVLVALWICHIAFAILGAVRAKEGTVKNYPLTIKLFKVQETST